ncbi:MAG: biotin--[acetyl-CoA-carboxylase] ligase [Bacteroidota bacterium]
MESTNQYALGLVSKSNPSEGTVISASEQTLGRGQIGRHWESEAHKNLTVSIILYPRFIAPQQQFTLNQAIALGVFDGIAKYMANGLKVKWSNDIYVRDRKIGGILVQNTLTSRHLNTSVVGIGLNVNQIQFSKRLPNPTSLALETGREWDLHEVLSQLCHSVEKRYLQLKSGDLASLHRDYLSTLYRYRQNAPYRRPDGTTFWGQIVGLGPTGKLRIEHNGGEELFAMREIAFVH